MLAGAFASVGVEDTACGGDTLSLGGEMISRRSRETAAVMATTEAAMIMSTLKSFFIISNLLLWLAIADHGEPWRGSPRCKESTISFLKLQ
jgi:hypothetical protein